MSTIMQGTTPSLIIKFNQSDLQVSDITAVELYIKNTCIDTYELADLVIDTTENSITKVFTEDETSSFNPDRQITVQGRFWLSGGSIVGMKKILIDVEDMLGVGV